MNSMLATEPTAAPEAKRALAPLESWTENERMRHVPPLDWMIRKLDGDLRSRIAKMTAPFTSLATADPHYPAIETELRALCNAIDRVATTAGGRKPNDPAGTPLPARIESAITAAAAALRGLETTAFGRRAPYHVFERSKSESVYGALLSVIAHTDRLVPLVRAIDADIDEKLLA